LVSKRQTVLDWLVDAAGPLKQITVANGYTNTIVLVERGLRDVGDLTDADFPFIFISSTDETREKITNNQFNAELVALFVGGIKSTTGVAGAQGLLDTLIADVTKALHADQTQGGRVYHTNIGRIRTDPGDTPAHALCFIEVTFKYATEGIIP
jgi:hypothetical protein